MKKIFVVLTLSAFMFACNDSGNSSNEPVDTPAVEQAAPTQTDSLNANPNQDSLNVNANSDTTKSPESAK